MCYSSRALDKLRRASVKSHYPCPPWLRGYVPNREWGGLMDAQVSWGEFKSLEPEMAAFGEDRLRLPPAYLATVRKNGAPRVHLVTPIVAVSALFVFMQLTERVPQALDAGAPVLESTQPPS